MNSSLSHRPFCRHWGLCVKTTQQRLIAIQTYWPLALFPSIAVTPTHPPQRPLSKCGPTGWVFPTGPSVAPGPLDKGTHLNGLFFLLLLLLGLKNQQHSFTSFRQGCKRGEEPGGGAVDVVPGRPVLRPPSSSLLFPTNLGLDVQQSGDVGLRCGDDWEVYAAF